MRLLRPDQKGVLPEVLETKLDILLHLKVGVQGGLSAGADQPLFVEVDISDGKEGHRTTGTHGVAATGELLLFLVVTDVQLVGSRLILASTQLTLDTDLQVQKDVRLAFQDLELAVGHTEGWSSTP